jgi:LysM repeat protein
LVFGLLVALDVTPARAASSGSYIVQPGDTLFGIARRHGIHVRQLASANGLSTHAWVYAGQRLKIPGTAAAPTRPASDTVYVVRRGDTLFGIARRHGVTASQLARANGLRWNAWVYVGQRLVIPGRAGVPGAGSSPVTRQGRWIDVNLSTQTLTAYQGSVPVFSARVSTGLPGTPTPVGEFRVWVKLRTDDMAGPGYFLADVPYVMYFYRGYGLHGTYWHDSFGTPMSHGCVNLSTVDARWLYGWSAIGTKVVTHY